jgi:hypothetical protein
MKFVSVNVSTNPSADAHISSLLLLNTLYEIRGLDVVSRSCQMNLFLVHRIVRNILMIKNWIHIINNPFKVIFSSPWFLVR